MPGGHRRYDEDTVRFLRAIKEAQEAGFSLAEIEDYLTVVRRGRVPAPEALRVRAAAKIDQIDARIARLRLMREELARIAGCACDSLDHCTCGAAYLARRGRDSPAPPSLLHVTNGESAGTRCVRPRWAARCCPGRMCCTRARCRPRRGRSCCGPGRLSCPAAAGAARRRSGRRCSGGTAPSLRRCGTGGRWCCGSSTTCTTSSSSWTSSPLRPLRV